LGAASPSCVVAEAAVERLERHGLAHVVDDDRVVASPAKTKRASAGRPHESNGGGADVPAGYGPPWLVTSSLRAYVRDKGRRSMELLLSFVVLTASIWITARVLPGFEVRGVGGAALVAVGLGLLQFLIGWLLFFVIGVGTLGLGFLLAFVTRWLVTAILLKVVDAFSRSLRIDGFRWAFAGALVMSALGSVGELAIRALL
jgi:putative membrane protein